jgi:hypothetical protein
MSDKGGNSGQWSARKAQLSVVLYKKRGGRYSGPLSKSAQSLRHWTSARWRTYSGRRSRDTGERYLPTAAWKRLSPSERRAFNVSKKKAFVRGKQYAHYPSSYSKVRRFVQNK